MKPNQIKSDLFNIYLKRNFALNKLQWLVCHETKPNQIKSITEHMEVGYF